MTANKLFRTTALTLLLAALPVAAFGDDTNSRAAGPQDKTRAVDVFLKMSDIKGESKDSQGHSPAVPDQLHVDQVLTGVVPKSHGHDPDLGTPTASTADDKHNKWIDVLAISSDGASPDDANPDDTNPGGTGPDGGDHDPGVTLVEMLPAAADTEPTSHNRDGEFWFEDLHPGHHNADKDPTATRRTQPAPTREGLSGEALRRVKTPLTESHSRSTRTPVLKKTMAPRPTRALRRTTPTVQPTPATPATPQVPTLRRQRVN